MISFRFAVIPFTYIFSFIFEKPASAFNNLAFGGLFIGMLTSVIRLWVALAKPPQSVLDALHGTFLALFPYYAFIRGLIEVDTAYECKCFFYNYLGPFIIMLNLQMKLARLSGKPLVTFWSLYLQAAAYILLFYSSNTGTIFVDRGEFLHLLQINYFYKYALF